MKAYLCVFAAALSLVAASENPSPGLSKDDQNMVKTIISDMHDVIETEYYPREKVGRQFDDACKAAKLAVDGAGSLNEAMSIAADALATLDPRISLLPPRRELRVDYSWGWDIVGNVAYVSHMSRNGDALRQGLKLGDRVLEVEGVPLDRSSDLQLYHFIHYLAPAPGLRVLVQSAGEKPRMLAIASTLRPQRANRSHREGNLYVLEPALSDKDKVFREQILNFKNKVHVGPVFIWRMHSPYGYWKDVSEGLEEARKSESMIIDLRSESLNQHECVIDLLNGLFVEGFPVGKVRTNGFGDTLRVSGRRNAFKGTVLVLVDAFTSGYAELLAKVIQQKQRGVIIGDHTMGRASPQTVYHSARGAAFAFSVARVVLPAGELVMEDGSTLDGKGVAPDFLLLPKPDDIAAQRDIVLAKAVKMLKQSIDPGEAFKMFWIDPDYED